MPLSGVLGAPISSLILNVTHNAGSLQGWKWLFVAEGLPSILLGIACFLASALPSGGRDVAYQCSTYRLKDALKIGRAQTEQVRKFTLREGFTNPRVLVLATAFFCLVCGSTGIGFFLPQIVKDLGFGTNQNGLVTAIPYLLSAVGMVVWSRHSDRTRERRGHFENLNGDLWLGDVHVLRRPQFIRSSE
jgi:ACS family tartrate transporter-like MFS transporter